MHNLAGCSLQHSCCSHRNVILNETMKPVNCHPRLKIWRVSNEETVTVPVVAADVWVNTSYLKLRYNGRCYLVEIIVYITPANGNICDRVTYIETGNVFM